MKLWGFSTKEGVRVTDAQGIEAEIPQASRVGAEELERKARFFAAFSGLMPQKMRPNL
jgi:hypothetical protein